ncbi:MAG: alpha/beta fold hydrolase [Spirosomataceae bacterium]
MKYFITGLLFFLWVQSAISQTTEELKKEIASLKSQLEGLSSSLSSQEKAVDDLLWYQKVGDVALIDKVEITGLPSRVIKNPTGQGAKNPLKFKTYFFFPKNLDPSKKYPLLVFVHGGVHANFDTYYTHIIREMIAQGYVIVAPEYRGSTGYGESFYRAIDYGGYENEDVKVARDHAIEAYDFIDSQRIGILGWSHGGMISLMNIFDHPESYKVCYAGVPVSDLVARMGYKTESYRQLYSADYHLGKSAADNVEEYKKRSPAWNAHKLQTPLLIHTNTNDEDVNVLEVEHLIKSLKAEGKQFEYEIYQDAPGGHAFNRIDTKLAKESRVKVYQFLAKHLSPTKPIKNLKELQKAGYGF